MHISQLAGSRVGLACGGLEKETVLTFQDQANNLRERAPGHVTSSSEKSVRGNGQERLDQGSSASASSTYVCVCV